MTSRWAFMRLYKIGNPTDGLYLWRLRIVQTPWFALYLHRFARPDSEPDLHDHPWPFVTLILRGGYLEAWRAHPGAPGVTRSWRRGSVHRIRLDEAHSIIEIKPHTATLVVTGRRSREWGFWTPTGWVAWQDYLEHADREAAES